MIELIIIVIVIALLVAILRRQPQRIRGLKRECPFCREIIPFRAIVCSHCGRESRARLWWEKAEQNK